MAYIENICKRKATKTDSFSNCTGGKSKNCMKRD